MDPIEEIRKKIEEWKNLARNLMKEGKLGGFFWKKDLYAAYRVKDEKEYRLIYRCPKCGYIGEKKVILKKVSGDKPMLVITCDKCGNKIDEIKKVPMR